MEENYLKKAELVYLENIQGLIDSVKIQQHDHLNHLSVIRKLLDEKNQLKLKIILVSYTGIFQNQNILKINHLPLAALIQTKMDKAKSQILTLILK